MSTLRSSEESILEDVTIIKIYTPNRTQKYKKPRLIIKER